MKFDFCIGNPAYNEPADKDGNETYAPPIYHRFIDEACKIAEKVEMIHPARFLFNAGSTPKAWNEKMLNDEHFKVLQYEEDCRKVFSNTEIKGGVAITYHDQEQNFGAIGIFTPYNELNTTLRRVKEAPGFEELSRIAVSSYAYHFTEELHKDNPNLAKKMSKGHAYDLKSNVLEKLTDVFFKKEPKDGNDYIKVFGRVKNERIIRYIRRSYITPVMNLDMYKVFIPAANGNGKLGETLSAPIIAPPGMGSTETFMSLGSFMTEDEARHLLSYIKTKFARALLSVLKVTQHITPEKWDFVPLQNFTDKSDINWNATVANIDRQLYKKYGLTQDEIDFIETHVKEME